MDQAAGPGGPSARSAAPHRPPAATRPTKQTQLSVKRPPHGATVVAKASRARSSAGVRRQLYSTLTCGNERRRTPPDPPQPPWQCGGQGFESPQLHPDDQGVLRKGERPGSSPGHIRDGTDGAVNGIGRSTPPRPGRTPTDPCHSEAELRAGPRGPAGAAGWRQRGGSTGSAPLTAHYCGDDRPGRPPRHGRPSQRGVGHVRHHRCRAAHVPLTMDGGDAGNRSEDLPVSLSAPAGEDGVVESTLDGQER